LVKIWPAKCLSNTTTNFSRAVLALTVQQSLSMAQAYSSSKYKSPDNGKDWLIDNSASSAFEFCISNKDSDVLAKEVTMPTIQFVLEVMANNEDGGFPTYANTKSFLSSRDNSGFGTAVPHNATARRSIKLQHSSSIDNVQISTNTGAVSNIDKSELNDVGELDEDCLDGHANGSQSIYSINNATTDIPMPMQQDLNCTSTVKAIVLHYGGLVKRYLSSTFGCDLEVDITLEDIEVEINCNPYLESENPGAYTNWPRDQWPTPWMQRLGPILCGDGQPTFAMLRLNDIDAKYQDMTYTLRCPC